MGRVLITHAALSYIIPLAFLDVNPNAHRRIIPDMREAYSMMALFFSDKAAMYDNDFDDKLGDHLIVNQVERAKKIPDRRRPQSNNNSPASLWKEVDALRKNPQLYEAFPEEWDRAIRPIIARCRFTPLQNTRYPCLLTFSQVYREGILRNSYVPFLAGQAFSHQESNRAFDLYVDFRMMINEITLNPELQEPPPFPQLLATARTFASHNPTARFAFLRLWSAPHFYPLIIGLEKRDRMAFYDGQGRAWEWKFIPKDMPFSEWSVHQQSRLRMRPFAKMLADRVWFRQDTFLVMGTDEKDLLKLASATTYAIQTDPWRLEVDLWRSFVNVDLQFLEGLDQQWLI